MESKRKVIWSLSLVATLTLILYLAHYTASYINTSPPESSDNLRKNMDRITSDDLTVDENGLSKEEAVIKTIHGDITFKFYPKAAPNTVTRIIELIQSSFYDGIVFHRVVDNFVIQGGDPTGTGTSGSGKKLKAEFGNLKHELGTLAMARSQDIDSADSQFYICLRELPHLDGKYTIFGKMVSGFEILPKVVQGDKILSMFIKQDSEN